MASTIAHEAYHLADYFMKFIGLTYDEAGNEAISYLVGDITQAIVNAFRRYKKAKGE